jgi:hypothetical protein
LPINEYGHELGISITGGYIYNGVAIQELSGKYIFGDWTGPLFFLEQKGQTWTRGNIELTGKPSGDLKILGFAEDNNAELYVLTNQEVGPKVTKGAIYKFMKP